ncbi:MAG: hypothetical protein L0220_22960, partial [Acidobacteria bacterium]|nr:hypothetical protein [Acidobacteriota bacterium]
VSSNEFRGVSQHQLGRIGNCDRAGLCMNCLGRVPKYFMNCGVGASIADSAQFRDDLDTVLNRGHNRAYMKE